MKKNCIIHIGMPKTASTSLQDYFYNNIEPNYKYPDIGTPYISDKLFSLFSENPSEYHANYLKNLSIDEIAFENQKFHEFLVNDINASNKEFYILSSEDFFHMNSIEVQKIWKFTNMHFDTSKIIGYVRNPTTFIPSAFQELCKFHGLQSLETFHFYHRYKNFQNFDDIFGRDSVILLDYEMAFNKNLILENLCSASGLKCTGSLKKQNNQSSSKEFIAIMFANNCESGFLKSNEYQSFVRWLDLISKKFGSNPMQFSNEFYKKIYEENIDDIQWIESRLNLRFRPSDSEFTNINCKQDILDLSLSVFPDYKDFLSEELDISLVRSNSISALIKDLFFIYRESIVTK